MPAYTNAYKGRANRQESASHLRDEFDRLETAFVTLQNANAAYIDIYNHGDSTEYVLIDPANGQMQEITLTQDALIQIKNPGIESASSSHRLTLIVHGTNFKIINGWGPQTWKEEGNADWMWIYTGLNSKAGVVFEFAYDGLAWCCLAFSRNSFDVDNNIEFEGVTAMFPLLADLWNVERTTVLTWIRNSYAWAADVDATFTMVPKDFPRFYGGRYVKNWIATPNDLQSVAFEEDGASVTTEALAGQDGSDVDKITFVATDGEVRAWMLLHFGRPAETADPIKFAVSFDAKMAGAVTSGTCRAIISIMGVDTGSVIRWDRKQFTIDGAWGSYGAILDPISGKDVKGLNLLAAAGARTLVKFAIESPSDGLGDPILIENVNVVVLKEGDDERVSLPIESTIGSSLTLAATAGSTGLWVDGTKTMNLDLGEYVDFQDSLDVGQAYLCVARRTTGNSANVLMEDDRTYWTAYSRSGSDTSFVKDAPFTFHYEGGVFKFFQTSQSSQYEVNIYKISDYISSYGTENANVISSIGEITYTEGAQIASNIMIGAAYEKGPGSNLLPDESHRAFTQWDPVMPMLISRSEFGVDGRPSHGTVVEDNATNGAGYIAEIITIPNDTDRYLFSFFVRKTFDESGSVIHQAQLSPAAGGPVTSPSRYVDFKMIIYDDAQINSNGWLDGDLVRIDITTGSLAAEGGVWSSDIYDVVRSIHYGNWWQVTIGITNNGTGNDRLGVLVFPSVGSSLSNPGVQTLSERGYAIIDWAQVEIENDFGHAQSSCIPGETRAADSITSTLDDGTLWNSIPVEVGDITTNVFSFDTRTVAKNITWIKT